VAYGASNSNAWNTPFIGTNTDSATTPTSTASIDLTKEDNDATSSTDTISQISQDLTFLRKEFNDSIQLTNKKRDDENTLLLDKISTLQKSTDTSINSLTTFIKGALTTQDEVITSLNTGQESMDLRMTTVTNNVQRQMNAMNQLLKTLQHTLLRFAGVPDADLPHTQCAMVTHTLDTSILGTQPVLLGGSANYETFLGRKANHGKCNY